MTSVVGFLFFKRTYGHSSHFIFYLFIYFLGKNLMFFLDILKFK